MRILSIRIGKRANDSLPLCFARVFLGFVIATPVFSASLPGGMTSSQISRAGEYFSMGSSMRPLRSAEAFPTWPGLKLGVEIAFQPTQDLNVLGNGQGTLPSFLPMPRFYVAKGIGENFELILGSFPFATFNTVATYGGLLKWTVRPEDEHWLAMAVYVAYTRMLALNSYLRAHTFETGVIMSKDWVRIRPYVGVAGAYTASTVDASLAADPTQLTGAQPRIKLFVGCEFELPLSLGVQVDFLGFRPTASFFIGQQW